MATYVPSFKGYIADVPEFWFRRCDGAIYHDDQLTSCSFDPEVNAQEINGGWSMYPVQHVPDRSALNLTVTSAQFNADLFAMTNATQFEDVDDYEIPVGETYLQIPTTKTPVDGQTTRAVIELLLDDEFLNAKMSTMTIYASNQDIETAADQTEYETYKNDPRYVEVAPYQFLYISRSKNGLNKDTYAPELADFVTNGRSYENYRYYGNKLTCFADDSSPFAFKESTFFVKFSEQSFSGKMINVDNRKTAIGEAVLRWPVYASGDDCTASGIKGYVVVKVHKCKVSRTPGFDNSYKSASEFSFDLTGMDAKRPDRCVWNIAYMPVDFAKGGSGGGSGEAVADQAIADTTVLGS